MENVEPPDEMDGFLFVLTEYGIFDILPICHEGKYHVGTFTRDPEENLLEKMERLTHEDKVYSSWFKRARRTNENQSCVVNFNSPIQNPYHDGVLIIGDAAWIQEMGNMASFCTGWKAANELTIAFIENKFDKEALTNYLKWWDDYFYKPFGHIEFGEVNFSKYLSADDMDYLVSLITEPLPGTLDFFELFSGIKDAYIDLIERIQEERPDVFEKLLTMRDSREDDKKLGIKRGVPNR